jgi:hypothetical protein
MPAFDYYKPLAHNPAAQANYGKAQAEQQYYQNLRDQAYKLGGSEGTQGGGTPFQSMTQRRALEMRKEADAGLARTGSAMAANAVHHNQLAITANGKPKNRQRPCHKHSHNPANTNSPSAIIETRGTYIIAPGQSATQ